MKLNSSTCHLEQLSERDLRTRIVDKARQDGIRLTTKGYVPGSSVDIDLVLGVLSGLGCLKKSSEIPEVPETLPYLNRIIAEHRALHPVETVRDDVVRILDSADVLDQSSMVLTSSDMLNREEMTTGMTSLPSESVNPSKKRKGVIFGEILSLEPSILLDHPEERLTAWRDLCYKESVLEETEEGLLRRIAGQCKIKLRSKPYYTGTRYLQTIFEPRPTSLNVHESSEKVSDMRPSDVEIQYTAEILYQKSKSNQELKGFFLRQNSRIQEVYSHFETSNNYVTFKRKYQAMMGPTSMNNNPHRTKVIPPLSLWADYHPIKNRHPDEIFADICIRSHPIPWSSVAQEFTTVEDSMGMISNNNMDDEHLGKSDSKPQSPVPFKRSSSFSDVVKRKLSNPVNMVVLAPGFREVSDEVRI